MGSRPQNPAGQSLPSQPATPLVSVIVNNYNHGDYLEQAIASALAQTYANVEVVVVDDGSTDDSREVIGRFDSRIVAVLKENGGQGSAFNAGLEHASGTVIMFLDSDDYLLSGAVERVVPEFGPGVAKVQFRLTVVDGEGRPTGEYPPPDAPLHRGDVRPLLVRRGVYSTAVCSGNAYARAAIEAIFPVPAKAFSYGADGYVNAAVPFFGEVRAIDERLGAYRIHGRNYSTMESSGLDVGLFHYFIGTNSLPSKSSSNEHVLPAIARVPASCSTTPPTSRRASPRFVSTRCHTPCPPIADWSSRCAASSQLGDMCRRECRATGRRHGLIPRRRVVPSQRCQQRDFVEVRASVATSGDPARSVRNQSTLAARGTLNHGSANESAHYCCPWTGTYRLAALGGTAERSTRHHAS